MRDGWMKFDELESRLRIFESGHDITVLPGLHIVARLDGRNFTRLTKDRHRFTAPYDAVFRDYMIETVKHLMNCGFRIIYGYTQSDEISLLFHPNEDTFSRKIRKYNSILAGEASAKFSIQLMDLACFDCRISQLPSKDDVVDYFRWRSEDATRNSLNGHCYWSLRKEGMSQREATDRLLRLTVPEKNELLHKRGINFNDLPGWQKRGSGVYWEEFEKSGWNPITQTEVVASRRRLKVENDLPNRDEYSEFVSNILDNPI